MLVKVVKIYENVLKNAQINLPRWLRGETGNRFQKNPPKRTVEEILQTYRRERHAIQRASLTLFASHLIAIRQFTSSLVKDYI